MVSNAGDDDYTYEGFDNYEATTKDPGSWVLIGVCVYSFACILLLPILVILGQRYEKRRMDRQAWTEQSSEAGAEELSSESDKESVLEEGIEIELRSNKQVSRKTSDEYAVIDLGGSGNNRLRRKNRSIASGNYPEDRKVQFRASAGRHVPSSVAGSALSQALSVTSTSSAMSFRGRNSRHKRGKSRLATRSDLYQRALESEALYPVGRYTSARPDDSRPNFGRKPSYESSSNIGSVLKGPVIDDIRPEDAADANDPGQEKKFIEEDEELEGDTTICFGPRALCSRRTIGKSINDLIEIAHFDSESRRIMNLGLPFTLASISESFFDALSVALVSRYLGVDALSAYVVTNLLISLSATFIDGLTSSLDTVCTHAVGAENYFLAGQYVQIASVLYTVLAIPVMGVWCIMMDECIRLFGLNDNVVAIGSEYTKIVIFHYILEGLFEGYTTLLDITGYAIPATIFDLIWAILDCAAVWMCLAFVDGFDLFWVGATQVVIALFCYIVFTIIAVYKGWLDPFWEGLVGSFAFKNTRAVKNIFETSIPLSIGALLEYGEWEALTFFAAALGPAEVAAWGVLESIWDLFESATEGLSEAGSIRLAFHLGKGNIEAAQRSTWKSLFMSTVLAVIISSIVFICGDDLAIWFTDDKTLQKMVSDVIPLIGIGNILMIFGMVSWSLVGAQGRYKLATSVSVAMSVFVTVPLATLSCFYVGYTLEGLVASIVVGYSTSGLCFAYILQLSDWEHISRSIKEFNDESDSSSESSSSSSDSDSDSDFELSEGALKNQFIPSDDEDDVGKRPRNGNQVVVIPTGNV